MRIVIPGQPIAKKRHRCGCRGRHPVAYDLQSKENNFMRRELYRILDKIPENENMAPIAGYLDVSLSFYLEVPESSTAAVKSAKIWDLQLPSKQDLSNMIKFYEDVGNQILWHDDSQIVSLTASMRFSETPCTIIEISAITTNMSDSAKKVAKLFTPHELDLLVNHLQVLKDSLSCWQIDRDSKDNFNLDAASLELIAFANDYSQKFAKLIKK